MTLQNIAPTHPFSGFVATVQNLRDRALARRQAHVDYTRTLNALSALSNRELEDIGIGRSDIPNIAAQTARMK